MKRINDIVASLGRRFVKGIENSPPLSGPHVKMLLRSFFWLLPALLILYWRGAAKAEAAFDFASYLLPCFAGGLAGAGLIFRGADVIAAKSAPEAAVLNNNERLSQAVGETDRLKRFRVGRDAVFYALSVFVLYAGIILYAMAHRTCRSSAITMCSVFFLVPVTRILISRLGDSSMALQRGFADSVVFVTILVLMSLTALALIICGPALWVNIGGKYLCSDQG